MKKLLFATLFSFGLVHASISDDFHILQGSESLKNKDTKKAIEHYEKIDDKTDSIKYNLGNLYYENKEYEKAIKEYESINSDKLKYKTLHNLGNSYAFNNNLEKAIQSYEEALKLKDDADTKFNLELLKKEQQNEKNQKENKENGKNNKTDDSQQDTQKKQNEKDSKENQEKNEQQKQDEQKNANNRSDNEQTQKYDENNESNENNQSTGAKQQIQKVPLSDIEEGKWNKQLEQRKIHTLMMPIQNKGEKNENINPW